MLFGFASLLQNAHGLVATYSSLASQVTMTLHVIMIVRQAKTRRKRQSLQRNCNPWTARMSRAGRPRRETVSSGMAARGSSPKEKS